MCRPSRTIAGVLLPLRRSALGPRLAFGALLAYFIAPCLHTLHHRNDHQHVGDAIRWVEEGSEHVHPRADFTTVEAPVPSHGRGGLAHFGAAVVPSPPFQPPPVFSPVTALDPPSLAPAPPRPVSLLARKPRGPPLSAPL